MAGERGNTAVRRVGGGRRTGGNARTRVLCLMVLAAVLLPASAWAQVLPAFRSPMIETPAPVSSYLPRRDQGSYTQGPSTSDAEIVELARGLKQDPGLMYKFVHDHIRFTPTWGETKGAYMTWMDRSGNAFDQATLLIALLTQAAANGGNGYTITNIEYGVGEITPSAAQFTSWFAIPNDARIAKEVLARGGFYADVSPATGSITSITMVHVWVRATINGVTRSFDPSFKSHTTDYGLVNLSSSMGYDSTSFLADAQRSGGGYDTAAIREDLDTYSETLVTYIKNHTASGDMTDSVADIVGGHRIEPVDEAALPPQTLPYSFTLERNFGISAIRSIYRTTLRIQHCGIDQTLYASDLYGRRLSIKYNASNQPQLILDGVPLATGTAATPGTEYDLILTVDHPYEFTDYDASTTLKIKAGGFYQIVNGWGDTGTKILLKHRGLLQDYKLAGSSDTSEEVLGESYAIVGLTWLAKTAAMRSLAAETVDSTITNHHVLGVAGQYDAPYTDLALAHLGVVDHASSDHPEEMFRVLVGYSAAYEHEVIRNLQNCNAVSAPRLLEMANNRTDYNDIYGASSYNWTIIRGQLVNYSDPEKARISAYITAGFSAAVPQYGDLTEDSWTGIGFRAQQTTTGTYPTYAMAYIVGGGYKGGASCTQGSLSPSTVLDTCVGAASDGDPEGAYGAGSTDITIGGGGYPFGLAFGRQYSSHRRSKDGPLGLGWTHNLDISAKVLSDSWRYLGGGSGTDAVPHIVSLRAAKGVDGTDDLVAPLCANWLMDKMRDNVVDIRQGASVMRFTKVVDKADDTQDVYQGSAGQTIRLLKRSNGNFRLKNASGIFYDFDASGRMTQWSDAHGNLVDFTYTDGKLTAVTSKLKPSGGGAAVAARSLSFTYTGDRITTVTDSASRSIHYAYDAYGQLTEFRNPDGNDVDYTYVSGKKGLLWKILSPVDKVNAAVRIEYDTIGRLKQVVDANNCTWDYYRATYRNEILPPAQRDHNNEVKRYGTVSWANPEARTMTSKDTLGRVTTSQYDPQGRTELTTAPSGTYAEFDYDANNNVITAEGISIPGSGDPNVLKRYGYCSYGTPSNAEQRWFVHMKQQTDTAGNKGYYYYDYNEPTNPGYLGELRKIAYMPANAATDANRPTVQFTYYLDGQVKHTKQKKDASNYIFTKLEYYTAAEGAGLKKTIADANGLNITTEVGYDNVGRAIWTKDPKGNIARTEYFACGRVKKTIAPAPFNYETRYEYEKDGKVRYVKQITPSFGSDPNCMALWRFESGALTKDSRGGNTLTATGSPVADTDAADYREGAASVDLSATASDCFSINDASLAAGFPLKNGDTNKKISVALWFKYDAIDLSSYRSLVAKTASGKQSLLLSLYRDATSARVRFLLGYNSGNSWETKDLSQALSSGVWYHLGFTFDNATKAYRIRLYNASTSTVVETTGTTTNNINVEDAPWYIGGGSTVFDGHLDAVTVFNDVLTTTEIDQIRQGTYGNTAPQTTILQAITYNNRRQQATVRGPYPENPTPTQLAINYTQYFYDSLGRTYKVIDAENHTTTTRYYPDGKVWKVIDAEGHTTVLNTYNSDGSLQQVQDAKGNVTRYEYNGFMGLKRTIFADNTFERMEYDGYRRLWRKHTRSDQTLEFAYDGFGRVKTKTVKKADSTVVNTIRYRYDLLGRLTTTIDNTGTIANTYDNASRVTQIAYPGSRTVAYQYDLSGNRTRLTYPDSTYITYGYDQLGQLRRVKNQSGTVLAQYSYDGRSRRTGLAYANGAGMAYEYDTASRLLSLDNSTNSGHHEYEYTYDKVGNRATMAVTNGGGTEMHVYSYDDIYQITAVDYPAGYDPALATDTTFNYDAAGNRTNVIDAGGTSTYASNALNQYTSAGGVSYDYDNNGNLTSDDKFQYAYDPENRLTSATKLAGTPDPLTVACDTTLVFTTGGSANWFSQSSTTHDGIDAAQSGDIGDSQESWLQTTVEGEGTLTFWWYHSSESNDYLDFLIDGVYQSSHTSGWQQKTCTIVGFGTHTLRWRYHKNSSLTSGSDCGWVDQVVWTPATNSPSSSLASALDTTLSILSAGHADWESTTYPVYYDGDSARSGYITHSKISEIQTTISGSGTLSFYWRVSSEANCDWLEFYLDGVRQDRISGTVSWTQKTYNVTGAGNHTLLWRYTKDSNTSTGDDRGYVDYLQWSGAGPIAEVPEWQTVSYTYDPAGRRIEKKVDGTTQVKYVYDGDHILAEYNSAGTLLRKYVHGPCVDEPICMIEASGTYAGTYYYHYDALGSVVAMTNSSGNVVQFYEYSVYGQVAASDATHPNRFMFTGREFDKDTGLYYYRARYYNPEIGRFLQTDPVGYGDGMSLYRYCRNNPIGLSDPSGLYACDPCDPCDPSRHWGPDPVAYGPPAADPIITPQDIASGDVLGVLGKIAAAPATVLGGAVRMAQAILDDIASHTQVAFYVMGQNGIMVPVKVFQSRSTTNGIPGLKGYSMNLGNEIHIGPEMAADLLAQEAVRRAFGQVGTATAITYGGSTGTTWEQIMAHELGHQNDADRMGILYPLIGAVATQNQDSDFEKRASAQGEYYGLVLPAEYDEFFR